MAIKGTYTNNYMRFHCEFKNCDCNFYIKRNNHRCLRCNCDVWHSFKRKPQQIVICLSYLRLPARTPVYEKTLNIEIFTEVPPLPDSDSDIEYCRAIEVLPV